MAIPQSFIQDLLARTDVVEVVGRYVQLRKTGANFIGLCPFHTEKTPSFSVSPAKQFYHCFGCGKSGNAIGFLMEYTGSGFVEVVHDLAQQYGLQVPDDARSAAEREQDVRAKQARAQLTDLLARAAGAYRQFLRASPLAIAYLKKRGVSGRVARDFSLGWAPEGWRTLAGVFADYADPLLEQAGLVVAGDGDKRYDRFRERIMFPIRDVKGLVIGFGGRVIDSGKPKYLNSSDGPVFHKGHELYGLFEARAALHERGWALVTEGYMDVVALHQLGFPNAVATLGTACTPDHIRKLLRLTDRVVFNFDGDAAGRAAAHKALQTVLPFATDTRTLQFLFLPPEHDPDSFIRKEGAAAFQRAVDAAVPLSRFLIDAAAERCAMDTAEGRARFAATAQQSWKQLPQGALAQQLLTAIAAQVQIGTAELEQLWSLGTARSQELRPSPRQRQHAPGGMAADRAPRRRTYPARTRGAPAPRALRALQIVLAASHTWLELSAADHQLLCGLPDPYGALFTWLDGQIQEHGPLTWSALDEALAAHPHADAARSAVGQDWAPIAPDVSELRSIVLRQRAADLKKRMNTALAAGDLDGYRTLLTDYTSARTAAERGPAKS